MIRVRRYPVLALLAAALASGILIPLPLRTVSHATAGNPASGNPPYDLVQLGIEQITGVVVEKLADTQEETILAASVKGVYVIRDQQIQRFIATTGPVTRVIAIDDINGDGVRDAVVAVSDNRFPNVLCYDTVTGRLLWQQSRQEKVFRQHIGWTTHHPWPTALAVTSDNRVVYATRDKLVILDGSTGMQRATYDLNNVEIEINRILEVADVNGDGTGDIMAVGIWKTPDYHFYAVLYVLSGSNLKRIRNTVIGLQLEAGNEPVEWHIEAVEEQKKQGINRALLTIRKIDIVGYSATRVTSYYTYIVDLATGRAVEQPAQAVRCAGDLSGDGYDELLGWSVEDESTTAVLKDGKTGDVVWSLTLPDRLGFPHILTVDGKRVILAAKTGDSSVPGKVVFTRIDAAQGTALADLEISIMPLASGGGINDSLDNYLYGYGDDGLLCVLKEGLLSVDAGGNTLWDMPVFSSSKMVCGDITGDGSEDVLLYSQQQLKSGDTVARRLIVVDGATRQPAWTYTVPYEAFCRGAGLAHVQLISDVNGDGKRDIAAYVKDGAAHRIVELSGMDGTVIAEIALGEAVYALEFIPYTAAYSYAVTTGTATEVISRGEAVLWSEGFAAMGSGISGMKRAGIRVLDDINGDGIPDLATLLPDMVVISRSDGWPSYTEHKKYSMSNTVTVKYSDMFSDFDGDGIRDIVIVRTAAGDTRTVVVSVATAEAILQFTGEPSINPVVADFNGDGYADHLVYQAYRFMGTKPSERQLIREVYVISGKDGTELCKLPTHENKSERSVIPGNFSAIGYYSMPAAAVTDVTGDGIPELAVYVYEMHYLSSTLYGEVSYQDIYITLYDVAQGETIKKIPLPDRCTNIHYMEQITDVNGNGSQDLLFKYNVLSGRDVVKDSILIMDIESNEIISEFGPGSGIDHGSLYMEDNSTLCSMGGTDLYYADMSNDLIITAPAAGSITGSPVRVMWDSGLAGSYTVVTAGGTIAGQTNRSYIDLSLTKGEHLLAIEVTDMYGKCTFAMLVVNVNKGAWSTVYTAMLFVASGVMLVAPKYARRIPWFRNKRGGVPRQTS